MSLRHMIQHIRHSQSGNVFFALFGTVALVGVVGASSMQIMKGPVRSMSEVTKRTVAENNMIASAKLALIAATSQSDSGDCDADGYVEPVPFEASATGAPAGGGFLPAAIGAALNDPWDTRYGYCSWDHGAVTTACGGSNYLAGENAATGYAIALISAGPDRQFQTTCNAYPSASAIDKVSGSDDIVLGYTYGEASALAGGLWNLKSGDAQTAEIDRNLEVKDESGNVTFALDAQSGLGDFIGLTTGSIAGKSGPLDVTGGLKFESDSIALNAACTEEDAFAFDTATDMLVRCDGSIWVPSGGSDNLGNHEATENIQLKGFWLSNDGDDEGLQVADDGLVSTSGDMTVNNNLTTTGGAAIGSTLGVTGATTLTTLSTSGLATLNSASVTQNAGIGGTLDVTAGTTLTSLTTSGAAQLNAATVDTTLGVTGATTLTTLSTSGLSTLDALAVTNNASVGGTLDMTSGKITNLLDPTLAQDAASKAYVDARVASGAGFSEADPQVGTIQSSKWCIGNNDGTAIVCDQNAPAGGTDTLAGLSCGSGQIPKWNGTVWACAADNAGGGGSGSSTIAPHLGLTGNAPDGSPWPDAIVCGGAVLMILDVFDPAGTSNNRVRYGKLSSYAYYHNTTGARGGTAGVGSSCPATYGAIAAGDKLNFGGGGTGVADNLGDHIATQSVRLFKATGSAGTVVAGTGDDLGNHTATTTLLMGANVVDFSEAATDKVLWYSNTYGTGIESGTLTNWAGTNHRWRIGGTSVSTGTERMLLNNTGLTVSGTITGNGSGLTNLNASNLASGTVASARLGTGTADGTTYLRGDGTWAVTPSGADDLGAGGTTAGTLFSKGATGYGYVGSGTAGSTGAFMRYDDAPAASAGRIYVNLLGTWEYLMHPDYFAPYATNINDLGTSAIRWKDGWFAGTVTATTGFAGPGTSLTALNATNLTSGTVAAARMPALTGDITMTAGTTVTNIAANAVTTAEIAADTITAADIAQDAVTSSELADSAVTIAKLAATGTADNTTFLRGDNTWAAIEATVTRGTLCGLAYSAPAMGNCTNYSNVASCDGASLASKTCPSGFTWRTIETTGSSPLRCFGTCSKN